MTSAKVLLLVGGRAVTIYVLLRSLRVGQSAVVVTPHTHTPCWLWACSHMGMPGQVNLVIGSASFWATKVDLACGVLT